ncbi:MAG: transcriptional regulator [Rhodospirillales bacterium]|nr:MAG: transcriptional regulator [Rhodospirillales bacterium]
MDLYPAKRVEIIIESVMEGHLTEALVDAGVTGFTIVPVSGGSGRSGQWSGQGQVSRAGGMVMFVCLLRPDRLQTLLDSVFPVLDRHIGVLSVTDTYVLRAERF